MLLYRENLTMPANDKQVGGAHYSAAYQHWDLMIDMEAPCPLVYASKYVFRWRKKNGLQDLEKAVHCLEKAEERCKNIRKEPELVEEFINTNSVHTNDAHALRTMLNGDYKTAISIIQVIMLDELAEPTSAYVNQG